MFTCRGNKYETTEIQDAFSNKHFEFSSLAYFNSFAYIWTYAVQ